MLDRSAQVVTLLAMLVHDRVGLSHGDLELFTQKVADHAEELGFGSMLDFYYSLRYDDPDGQRFDALLDALVVGETYFFREPGGLQLAVEQVRARAARGQRSRIWSAGCATGEEPLSLAALLAEADLLDRVEILATDVSPRHLDRASRGDHSRRALRTAPEGRPPWIRSVDGAPWVDPTVRAAVEWRRVNLVDRATVRTLGRFDAILCRNVLIYFDEPTIAQALGGLVEALDRDGVLIVGVAESLLRFGAGLECVERGGAFLYRRTAE
jgi:chemotaxis protein methyltransferase CheR